MTAVAVLALLGLGLAVLLAGGFVLMMLMKAIVWLVLLPFRLLFALFFALMLIGTPIGVALAASGAVAIAFAKHRPTWQVTGTDLSADAVEVARANALRLGTVWGVRFAEGNLFEAVGADERFELITANPPYIPAGDIPGLQADIREFEPHLALDGGADGLRLLPAIAQGAFERLTEGGTLAVEIGAGQSDEVAALFERTGFVNVRRHRDLGGHERVVSGKR